MEEPRFFLMIRPTKSFLFSWVIVKILHSMKILPPFVHISGSISVKVGCGPEAMARQTEIFF